MMNQDRTKFRNYNKLVNALGNKFRPFTLEFANRATLRMSLNIANGFVIISSAYVEIRGSAK